MTDLPSLQCEACRADAPKVTDSEIAELLHQIPDWEMVQVDKVDRLVHVYAFPDFVSALSFSNRVGELAEKEGHHPAILTEYGKVTISWWTHKIGGLHVNDFILAAKTDRLFQT